MSHIDRLLAELAPNGVEVRTLGDIAITIPGLSGKSKADFSNGNSRYVSYRNVFANISVDQAVEDFVRIREGEGQNLLRLGDVIVTGSSESLAEVGMSSVIITEPSEPLYLNSFCFAVRFSDPSLFLPGFLKYLFRAESIRSQIRRTASGVTRINVSKSRFMKLRVPVPPVEVQSEIAKILDEFTNVEADLETNLSSELRARRQQHNVFHERAFERLVASGAPLVPLREIGKWYGGGTPSKTRADFWANGTIPWISPKDMVSPEISVTQDYITHHAVESSATKLVPGGSVALVVRSSILDHTLPVAFVPMPAALNQDMKAVVPSEGIMPEYVFRLLRTIRAELLRAVRRAGGSVPSLQSEKLWRFKVPVPTIEEQRKFVEYHRTVDRDFTELISTLHAELAERGKQYEYYRDKLLTFTEIVK